MVFSRSLCILLVILKLSQEYEIPPLQLEAFEPTGLKVSLKADPKTQLFAFHGKLNEDFKQFEPGDFTEDIRKPTGGFFVYDNPSLQVKPGDEINYWVFVQNDGLGFKKENQKWKVEALKSRNQVSSCIRSITKVSGHENVCSNKIVFQDEFNGTLIDNAKWTLEQYIPAAPDHEFVIYKKDDAVSVQNNQLIISPQLQNATDLNQNVLDLTDGCTKPSDSNRFKCRVGLYLLQNPIISGRLTSKVSFSHIDVEIRAKLPSGDWLYPEIYLEDENYNKLVIAYARGNKQLTGNDKIDIGGSLLFGGPILSPYEPNRSEKLSSYKHLRGPLSDDFHTYRLKWTSDQIELYIDGNKYGSISVESIQSSGFAANSSSMTRLVLGVGVGGISDFPDDYQSGNYPKPWKNKQKTQVLLFYKSMDKWMPTWNKGGELKIDYVRINSI